MRSAGADNINLSRATVEWVGPQTAKTLTYSQSGVSDSEFNTSAIKGEASVLSSTEDRLTIDLDAEKIEGGEYLQEGDQVKLKITTQFGSTTVYYLNVPESLSGKSAVQL